MKYSVRMSTRFKKDMKLVQKRGYDQRLIFSVIEMLANGMKLDEKCKCAEYSGEEIVVALDWLSLEYGLPKNCLKLLEAWMEIHREDLEANRKLLPLRLNP